MQEEMYNSYFGFEKFHNAIHRRIIHFRNEHDSGIEDLLFIWCLDEEGTVKTFKSLKFIDKDLLF